MRNRLISTAEEIKTFRKKTSRRAIVRAMVPDELTAPIKQPPFTVSVISSHGHYVAQSPLHWSANISSKVVVFHKIMG